MSALWLLLKRHSLSIILILAIFLRLPLLNGSFWLDEAAQALESARPFSQQLQITQDFQPPLMHLLIHGAVQFATTEWWLRLIGALIPGLCSVFFTYKLANFIWNRQVAIISTLLLATSSLHIFYSQELRPYALAACWASLSWWILAREMKSKNHWNMRTTLFYGLTTTAGLYTTYLYPFVVFSQLVYCLVYERAYLKQIVLSLSVSALLFLPWVPFLLEQLYVGQNLRTDLPGWESVVATPQYKSLPLVMGKFIYGVVDLDFNTQFIVTSLVLVLLLSYVSFVQRKLLFHDKNVMMLFIWLVVPIFTSWIVSFFIPILQPKRVLFGLPAQYLLLAVFTTQLLNEKILRKKIAMYSATTVLLLFMGINIHSTVSYFRTPQYQRENWRLAHQIILYKYPQSSAVVFAFPQAFAPWRWYDDGHYPVIATGSLTTTDTADLEVQLKTATNYSYILVFDYLRDLTDPDNKIEFVLHGLGYTQKDLFSLPNIGFIRVYARTEAVLS